MTTQRRMNLGHQAPLIQHMRNPSAGQVYYVSGAGQGAADTNDGRTPESAFLTIDYAIGQCTAAGDDYIFVIVHDNATETWPIVVDVANVHIIGNPSNPFAMPDIRIQDDVDGFDVTADDVEIAGLNISTNSDAHTNRLIDCTGGGCWFHHNYMAWFWWGYDGIYFAGAGCSNNLVEHNYLGAHGFSHWHVTVAPQANRIIVRDNVCILNGYQTGNCILKFDCNNRGVVKDNTFMVPDLANGEAVYTETNTNLFTGNEAMSGNVAMTFNPYRDTGANNWGINYANIAAVLPVTV